MLLKDGEIDNASEHNSDNEDNECMLPLENIDEIVKHLAQSESLVVRKDLNV